MSEFDEVIEAGEYYGTETVEYTPHTEIFVSDIVFSIELAKSKNEARRLIEQRGIKIDGRVVEPNEKVWLDEVVGSVFQRGRREFRKLGPMHRFTVERWGSDWEEDGYERVEYGGRS